jgi:hypothetical protein
METKHKKTLTRFIVGNVEAQTCLYVLVYSLLQIYFLKKKCLLNTKAATWLMVAA